LGQVALGRAGVMAEVAQHLAVHVGDVVRPVAQEPVLHRAVGVHDVVNDFQDIVVRWIGALVDNVI
jgi:hypothetical protein